MHAQRLSCLRLFVTTRAVACQAPLSIGFSRQEYWSGLPFPSSGNLPDPGIEAGSPMLQAISLPSKPPEKPNSVTKASEETFPLLAVHLMHRGIRLCFSTLVLLVHPSLTPVHTLKRVPAIQRQNSTHTQSHILVMIRSFIG